MQATSPPPLNAKALQGWKYFRRLTPLLARLHDAGCQRDHAGNRTLHFDEYCALLLFAMFNPMVRSLRSLSQLSDLDKVREQLGVRHASLGPLSEAAHVFDPDLLLPIIAELAGELRPRATDPRLKEVRHILTAVDSTLLKTLPCLAEARYSRSKNGDQRYYWRLHTPLQTARQGPGRPGPTRPPRRAPAHPKGCSP